MTEEIAAAQDAVKTPEGVETKVTEAPKSPEFDYEAILAAKDAEIAQIRSDKENYRRAALKAKGKLPDDSSSDEETEDERIARIVDERVSLTREAQATAEREALIKKMAKENSELRTAVKNRSNMTPAGGSAGPESEAKIGDNLLSQDQIIELKKMFPNWTDKEIEAYKKNRLNN